MTPGEGRRFGVLPKPAVFTFGPLDYQLTMTRDGDAAIQKLERELGGELSR
jgi:hypothetical protein